MDEIGLFQKAGDSPVDIPRLGKPEMEGEITISKNLCAGQQRMIDPSFQPDVGIQRASAYHNSGKPDPVLKNDSDLLGIDRRRAAFAGNINIFPERLTKYSGLPLEMIGDLVPPAGMPEILVDEPVSAARTLPQRFYR